MYNILLKQIRYGLPQTSLVSNPHERHQLSKELFGEYALKSNLSRQISPNPLIVFCREYKDQNFTGDKVFGFATEFCNDFYLSPTPGGICNTKNLDLKKIIKLDEVYKTFFETEKQSSELKVGKDSYWAVSTYVINPLKIDPSNVST